MCDSVKKKSIVWQDKKLILETGELANNADASVLVKYGRTSILCVLVVGKDLSEDTSFVPLTVHYCEKWYATGKIPASFMRREGRPSERETLVARLIDRSLRPMLDSSLVNCPLL